MSHILAVDVGNTFTKFALVENGKIAVTWQAPTSEVEGKAITIVANHPGVPIVLSSVVPEVTAQLEKICNDNGRQLHKISSKDQSIITVADTNELGADLLAAAVGARKLYAPDTHLIVVGLGTANTLIMVDAKGKFQGCYITLGLTSTLSELARLCALVPQVVSSEYPANLMPGFSTEEAVRNGSTLALVSTVETWIQHAKQQLHRNHFGLGIRTKVVATGGWSVEIAKHNKNLFDHVDPELVLKGISFLYESMRSSSG